MSRTHRMLAAACVALFAVACNKGPAEEALRLADQEIAAAQGVLASDAPGELEALLAAVRQARAQLDQGHYTDALRAAQGVPAKVRAALAVAAAEKEKRVATWTELAGRVPARVEAIATRIAWFTEAQRRPRGMDEEGFAGARTDLEALTRAWAEAVASFQGGDVAGALRAGQEVEVKAEALAARLGLVASPPPSLGPKTPSPTPAAPSP